MLDFPKSRDKLSNIFITQEPETANQLRYKRTTTPEGKQNIEPYKRPTILKEGQEELAEKPYKSISNHWLNSGEKPSRPSNNSTNKQSTAVEKSVW